MKCNICGREYIALGVHLRLKHKIAPAEYREEYGLLLATPLVDNWLSERISSSQKLRLKDPGYKAEIVDRCLANAAKRVGEPVADMTQAGKASIARSNKLRNQEYLEKQAVIVAKIILGKKTMLDVRKATGTGPIAGRKMAKIAGVSYSSESAKAEGAKRAAATIKAKALARVAKVMPYFYTTKSAAEMCRLGGISIKTYRNWLAAGLIARHPNGRGPSLPNIKL